MRGTSVQTCISSPPYWGLRNYGVDGQLGLEKTPEEYVARLVDVFREVRRVLKDDGTLWLNLGDCYATGGGKAGKTHPDSKNPHAGIPTFQPNRMPIEGLKPKDLVGIPWRVAFALQADGWYLRSDIIWSKGNPMPESVTDRPTRSHEYLFLLTKSRRYYYDHAAVKEPLKADTLARYERGRGTDTPTRPNNHLGTGIPWEDDGSGRNRRTVWSINTRPFKGAHSATFPPALVEPCLLAGSRPGDVVLDPFNGAATTGLVALEHGRRYVGIELNPEYVAMSHERLAKFAEAKRAA
jgi:DNA modification methylase